MPRRPTPVVIEAAANVSAAKARWHGELPLLPRAPKGSRPPSWPGRSEFQQILDITLIRTNPAYVQAALAKRAVHVDIDAFLRLDSDLRRVRGKVERLRGDRRAVSGRIAQQQRASQAVEDLRTGPKSSPSGWPRRTPPGRTAAGSQGLRDPLPNLPDDEVPAGGKENTRSSALSGSCPGSRSNRNKVEMFQFTRPEDSAAAHEELLAKTEKLVAGLGLHYRVTRLASQDTAAAMAKTYDVEAWLPSLGTYVEFSSVSNALATRPPRRHPLPAAPGQVSICPHPSTPRVRTARSPYLKPA